MDYIHDIKPREDAGLSDLEIASILSSLTNNPIPISDLENFLDFNNLAKRNPKTSVWEGPLIDLLDAQIPLLSDGIATLLSHINKPRSVQISTSVDSWALMASNLLAGLLQAGAINQGHISAFYQLGGGLKNGIISENDVMVIRNAHNAMMAEPTRRADLEALKVEIENTWINPAISDGVSTVESIKAAIKAGL